MRNEYPDSDQENKDFGSQRERRSSSGEGSDQSKNQKKDSGSENYGNSWDYRENTSNQSQGDRDGRRPRIYRKPSDDQGRSSVQRSWGNSADRPQRSEDRERSSRPHSNDSGRESRPRWNNQDRPPRQGSGSEDRPRWNQNREDRPRNTEGGGDRPYRRNDSQGDRPSYNREQRSGDRPNYNQNREDRPRWNQNREDRPRNTEGGGDRPFRRNDSQGDRPSYNREQRSGDRPHYNQNREDRPRWNQNREDRPRSTEGGGDRPYRRNDSQGDRPTYNRDQRSGDRPNYNQNREDRPRWNQNREDRPRNTEGGEDRPFRRDNNRKPYGEGNRSSGGFRQREDNRPKPWELEPQEPMVAPDYKTEVPDEIRLNKYLANAGLCSRREADEYIKTGVVKVNDVIITEMGYRVKSGDIVRFNDEKISVERKIYLILNKPKDYVTTTDDPHAKKNVMELVENACKERIYPVGRLDRSTTGVLLFTNDGDMAGKLTHPSHLKKKIYHIHLDKPLTKNHLQDIADGITLDDGPITVDAISYAHTEDKKQVGVEIHSGRNRIVRRIFESLGYRIKSLDRVYFAGLTKKNLPRGRWRFLTEQEVGFLKMNVFK